MPKSYRIRTEPGVNKQIRVNIEQDFDFLEILSLKLRQEEIYTRFCADYGVVTGRVIANGGFGVPNANISIFIPLSEIDENDPIISTLYPYKSLRDKNEDGYRYNLLPYVKEYDGHTPTGTFPDREDVLTRKEVLEVYEKYYKYTVRTNDSGDFMIVGVPLGVQKIVMDLDLSNMGQFSLRPADLVRMGMGVPSQFNGKQFKSSEDIDSLPQIVHSVQDIDISSFWGDGDVCDVGITRVDFDLRDLGIEIQPHSIFMGSLFSTTEQDFLRKNCKSKSDTGNLCDTVTGPGQMLSIRQTIDVDENGDPILEVYNVENNGYVIDDNGVWLMELPMNVDYVVTNEFGEQVISQDPSVGIPTKGKYRFKIKWMDESGLNADVMRANYLIPNIRENGWTGSLTSQRPTDDEINKSYAFSLNWEDYYDKNVAINCEDTFYEFYYNKVYTVASHIDRFKWGLNRARHLGIKEITDRTCQSEVNKMPTNDAQRNFDLLFFLFNLFLTIVGFLIIVLIPVIHIAMWVYNIIIKIITVIIKAINKIIKAVCKVVCWAFPKRLPCSSCDRDAINVPDEPGGRGISLPMMAYPDCEACPCEADLLTADEDDDTIVQMLNTYELPNTSALVNASSRSSFDEFGVCEVNEAYNENKITVISGYDFIDDYVFSDFITTGPPTPPVDVDCEDPQNTFEEQQCASYLAQLGEYYENNAVFYRNPRFYKSPVYINSGVPSDYNLNYLELQPFIQAGLTGPPDYYIDILRTDVNVTLAQNLNLINSRSQYFVEATDDNAPNRIKIKLKNGVNNDSITGADDGFGMGPVVSNEYEDQVMLLVFDADASIETGQLLTFNDTSNINDPNFVEPSNDILYSGITVRNDNIPSMDAQYTGEITVRWRTYQDVQNTYILSAGEEYILPGCVKWATVSFTGAGIGSGDSNLGVAIPGTICTNPLTSGTTEFNDGTSLIFKDIQYIDWEGNPQTSTIGLFNDNPDTTYKFKTGVEYFQVITATTIEDHLILCNEYDDPNCDNIQENKQGEQWWNLANNIFQQALMQKDNYQYCQINTNTNFSGPFPYRTGSRFQGFENLKFALVVRGVDPWTPKQKIEYDLSLLYGHNNYNNVKIIGDYFINVPIQPNNGDSSQDWYNDYRTPAPHYETNQVIDNIPYIVSGVTDGNNIDITWNDNSISAGTAYNIFFPSYLYSLDTPEYEFVPFSSDTMVYYSSLDKSLIGNGSNILLNEYLINGVGGDNAYSEYNALGQTGSNYMSQRLQEVTEGNSIQTTTVPPLATQPDGLTPLQRLESSPLADLAPQSNALIPGGDATYTVSIIYSGLTQSPHTMIDDPNKLVMRSDRIPSSDLVETFDFVRHEVTRRYVLNLNNNFALYSINPEGDFGGPINLSGEPVGVSDASGNLDDLQDSGNPLYESGVLDSFTCTDMVPLTCYSGNAESFGVEEPCDESDRVVGGCYKIIRKPYIKTIGQDIKFAKEWRIRLRFIFGACRGVVGHMFQNNWINGVLYMPSFQKLSVFNSDNEVSSYRYCGSEDGPSGTHNNGPLYFNTETNSFYYRSTPYGNGTFYGQKPDKTYKGQNNKNIWFPTTIMELGPRDEFLKQVAFSSEFEGYIVDTLTTTSYKDTSDILNLFIIGRLVNGNFWKKIINLGGGADSSINVLFSREGDGILNNFYDARVDGDFAQAISINSEYGVLPYLDGNYSDDITITEDRMGIWFSSNTINRRVLTNGVVTLGNLPESASSTFGYSKSQEVPYYMWKLEQQEEDPFIGTFGSQKNSWYTDTIYSSVYQGDDFFNGTSQKYMKPNYGYGLGYLYNRSEDDPQLDALPIQNTNGNKFKVGSPFHFYFGHKRGKSAMNKFIIKYIFLSEL